MDKYTYKIEIITIQGEIKEYIRESKCDNFFTALDTDLTDILDMILDDDCIEYDYHILYEVEYDN